MTIAPVILAELQRGGPPLWVADRTYRVGQCVLSPADGQVYMRSTGGAGAVDPKNDGDNYVRRGAVIEAAIALMGADVSGISNKVNAIETTVNAINAGAGIKSIQRGTASFGGTGSVMDITIAAVNPSKTEVRNLGWTVKDQTSSAGVQLQLINATTLRMSKNGDSSGSGASWEITEWN